MTRKEHLELLEKKMKKNLEIANKKNQDYCGQSEDSDPFKNFKECEQDGIPAEKGIFIRMRDKMGRISSLLKQDAKVEDESIQDALMDLSNYALILSNYLDSKKNEINNIPLDNWLCFNCGSFTTPKFLNTVNCPKCKNEYHRSEP